MAFTFKISKPPNWESTLAALKGKIVNGGGTFQGDTGRGQIAVSGVEGSYVAGNDNIAITITKNPYVINALVEKYIRDVFRSCNK